MLTRLDRDSGEARPNAFGAGRSTGDAALALDVGRRHDDDHTVARLLGHTDRTVDDALVAQRLVLLRASELLGGSPSDDDRPDVRSASHLLRVVP